MSTITPIAPPDEVKYGPPSVQKEIKKQDKRRPVFAGHINVRVLVYRKEDTQSASFTPRHFYRILFIDDRLDRQYVLRHPENGKPLAFGSLSEAELAVRLARKIEGTLPNPGAWSPKHEEHIFMLEDGFEFYHEIKSARIGHTIKAPTKEGA